MTLLWFIGAGPGAQAQTPINSVSDLAAIDGSSAWYVIQGDLDVSSLATIATFDGTLEAAINPATHMPYRLTGLTQPLVGTLTGTVRNLVLEAVAISGHSGNTGAVACTATGAARVYNVGILSGSVGGTAYTGGLVGALGVDSYARVVNCYSFATITGGTTVAGIVGYNPTLSKQNNTGGLKTMIVNCMFYGDITGGTTKYPVYGGIKQNNAANDGLNNYNYFLESAATFDVSYSSLDNYNLAWPVKEERLTRFEVYRSILNSNRRLCTWWVAGTYGTCPTDAEVDEVGIAKWVLDPAVASYPVLKEWGKYPSVVNIDPERVWNPQTKAWTNRSSAHPWEGRRLGTLAVTVKAGTHHSASHVEKDLVITDMDTLGSDYCYGKVQLPYYNEVFGNPASGDHLVRYADNYTDSVVTGWKVTAVDHHGTTAFEAHWEHGYNFADPHCTGKDLYDTSGRVFAQGGYYYVPDGVAAITIEAYWGKAVYLRNNAQRMDRVNNGNDDFTAGGALPAFGPAGSPYTIQTSLANAVGQLAVQPSKSVYDQAIVLVGNYQQNNFHSNISLNGSNYNTAAKPFTIMSADLDFDNEPDFCFQAGMSGGGRENVQPIRFDFLYVPDITWAIRTDGKYYGMRIFCPQGHFEITETSYMYTTQFEYDKRDNGSYNKHEAPLILNGGEFEQIVSTEGGNITYVDRTSYIIVGGRLWMKAFTPGTHGNRTAMTRHCAVNIIGGEFPEFYLSGMFRSDFYNNTDNPHCYTNGGKIDLMAGAGMESVGAQNETNGGDVTFQLNHSLIREFYGGGINALKPVTGNIEVTADYCMIHKYCGGPRAGDMTAGKHITNHATGTTFGVFFGGGNGGNSKLRVRKYDSGAAAAPPSESTWNTTGQFNGFAPFAYNATNGYQAEYEFELLPMPNGSANVVIRSYGWWYNFAKTSVAPVTTTLNDCTVLTNFYGGGFLGAVAGDISSTLTDTRVLGNVYGAGYSASIPTFPVHDKSTVQYAYVDKANYIHDGSLDYAKYSADDEYGHHAGDTIQYMWCYKNGDVVIPEGVVVPAGVNTGNPTFQYNGQWYVFTNTPLQNLGTVQGTVSLTIEGDSRIGTVEGDENSGNVFGGGEQSSVDGSTNVVLRGNTEVFGNVYGGGNQGSVSVHTSVRITD